MSAVGRHRFYDENRPETDIRAQQPVAGQQQVVLNYFCKSGGAHSATGDVWYRVAEAVGPDAERYQRYLCGTLSNLAPTTHDCDRILLGLQALQIGSRTAMTEEGLDVSLSCMPDSVQVDIDINPAWVGRTEGRFLVREYMAAMSGWKLFLELPEGATSSVSVQL
ncbi:hypothetical protein [Variovorax fucosicus]|uniref:hypothetical protein n=1 Tax=Variovorax fucosicus TaxID=3053517 RepID=UPI0025753A46|nr:hypothetical protein [Variovorax sp. J22G47]MDM0056832.1 hypothetical protein [Variovorax sp. J22G47]